MSHRRTTLSGLAAASALLLALAACGTDSAGAGAGDDPGQDGGQTVVTSFYPLQFATAQIAGDRADVSVLTKPGTEPHDLELGAQDIAAMASADLVVYAKGFQPAVDEAMAQVSPARVLDVSAAARLTLAPAADEHEHEGESEQEHGAHSGQDPHFWLDPHRYAAVAKAVGERFAVNDPAHAAAYGKNTDAFVKKLSTLDAEYQAGLASCTNKVLVTSHSAFGYLAERYGFEQHGISGLSPEAEPSAATLKQIGDLVRDEGVTTIYQETLVEGRFAETVANTAGVKLATLDPVEGINDTSAGHDYFEVMRSNLATLRAGQGCR